MSKDGVRGLGLDRREVVAGLTATSLALTSDAAFSQSPADRYDVVIVGGGSAGCVLAAELSADPTRRVLLIEAGPDYSAESVPDDLLDPTAIPTSHAWQRESSAGYLERSVDLLAGKVTGGSSATNACVAARGLPSDYNEWARICGSDFWRYENILPTFRDIEADPHGRADVHGRDGPVPIMRYALEQATPFQRAFFDAAREAGFPTSEDINGADPQGINLYKFNIADGHRQSAALCFLTQDVRARRNLHILPGALVDRVQIENGVAAGVVLATGVDISAGEVILSAGSYASPAILIRSGVGPATELASLGIPVIADLPVGRFLQDHPHFWMQFSAHADLLGSAAPALQSFLWTASRQAMPGVLDLHLTASHFFDPAASPTGAGFVIAVGVVKPEAIGSLRLRSADPNASPIIDAALLAHQSDRTRMIEGITIARKLAATSPLSDLIAEELMPGAQAQADEELLSSLRANVGSYHHPVGTVRMGRIDDDMACVSEDGRVFDIGNLRVIDASIIPSVPASATNLTTMMIAHRLAQLF